MNGRLAEFVSGLFVDAPKTRQAHDLREELLASLQDKYNDLVNEGYEAEEAYQTVISNVGDVDELVRALDPPSQIYQEQTFEQRKKSALLTAVGVMLIIFGPMSMIVIEELTRSSPLSMAAFFTFVAVGVGVLVYTSMLYPKYKKRGENLVEDFKEFNTERSRNDVLKKTIITCVCCLTLPLYFIISFITGGWKFTWVIWVMLPALIAIINAVFAFKEYK